VDAGRQKKAEAIMADLLFIVSRAEQRTYMYIKHVFANEERDVRVILDRRERERRRIQRLSQTDRRHIERRHRDVTWELQSTGWAVVRRIGNPMTSDTDRCVAPQCDEEGIVGLNGAWLCLTHFEIRFAAMKAAPHGQIGSNNSIAASLPRRPR
jgi:hypothetical protein